MRYPIGSKVRIQNFPPPSDPSNSFDYNGKVGVVKSATHVGTGLNNQPVYDYEVHFPDVDVTIVKLNTKTNTLERTVKRTEALNRFDEAFLSEVQ